MHPCVGIQLPGIVFAGISPQRSFPDACRTLPGPFESSQSLGGSLSCAPVGFVGEIPSHVVSAVVATILVFAARSPYHLSVCDMASSLCPSCSRCRLLFTRWNPGRADSTLCGGSRLRTLLYLPCLVPSLQHGIVQVLCELAVSETSGVLEPASNSRHNIFLNALEVVFCER